MEKSGIVEALILYKIQAPWNGVKASFAGLYCMWVKFLADGNFTQKN